MLRTFDWLCRSRSGTELIATLEYQSDVPDLFPENREVGPPISALIRPCTRCWVYPALAVSGLNLCKSCLAIITRSKNLGKTSRNAIVIWGFVNHLPHGIRSGTGFYAEHSIGQYIHDEHHFLMLIDRWKTKQWFQDIILYHGSDLRGLIQIIPTCGEGTRSTMGDIIARAVHQDSRFPMDCLRVRFYSSPYQIFTPRIRDEKGMLTFEVTEFLRWLEVTSIFRSLLRPDEQEMLFKVLDIKDMREEQFYWGRFIGYLNQESKDMLSAWKIRQWSKNQIRLMQELLDYVVFTA